MTARQHERLPNSPSESRPRNASLPAELIAHLCRQSRLDKDEAARLIVEVLTYYGEQPGEFLIRRHQELQAQGLGNQVIFTLLAHELGSRLFRAPALSRRQIRRCIYG